LLTFIRKGTKGFTEKTVSVTAVADKILKEGIR